MPPPHSDDRPVSPRASPAPAELLAVARAAALDAAALLREGTGRRRRIEHKSTATDLVTEMDRAAEQLLVERILGARPDDAVVGEEGATHPGTSGVRWVVDPVDGTTNYVYGFPAYAVSVAAELDGDPDAASAGRVMAGVVVDVARDEVYEAHAGGGATRAGEPIRCTDERDLGRALVATGFSYESERRARQARVLTAVLPRVRDIRRAGAASLDLCAVACGRVDAFYEKGLQPWDLAAGSLIAREAGAHVGDLHGGEPSESFVLACAPGLAGALGDLLARAGAGDA